jgi:hypothetical protein
VLVRKTFKNLKLLFTDLSWVADVDINNRRNRKGKIFEAEAKSC